MRKLIDSANGYFLIMHNDGTYSVERGSYDIRVEVAVNLTYEQGMEYLRGNDTK